jgi:hypothetical protein
MKKILLIQQTNTHTHIYTKNKNLIQYFFTNEKKN